MPIQDSINGIIGSFSAVGVAKKYFGNQQLQLDQQKQILSNQEEMMKKNVEASDNFNIKAQEHAEGFATLKKTVAGDEDEEQVLQDSMDETFSENPGLADLFREYGSLPTYMTEKAVKRSLEVNGKTKLVKTLLEQKKNGGAK